MSIKNKIIIWIRKQVKQAKADGIVFGLSGGIDSAVVAALAKEAVGKNKVLALIIPCHSHRQDLKDAMAVARKFGIKTKIIDLSVVYDTLFRILPSGNDLARNNLKPRLRMSVIYYFANKLNYIVCGTGNKSELSVGYFTKYGDGGVDILPIGGLLKRQVFELARDLGIPQQIITKPPTAGLWPGQTDEGEMGIMYSELDDILQRLEKRKKQALSNDKIHKVLNMLRRSEHKRQGPPVCKISSKI